MDGAPWFVSGSSRFSYGSGCESCSAHGLLLKTAIGTPLKTKVRPWGTAARNMRPAYSSFGS